jgi:ABC-type Co2+ transport system permease subunit
VAHTALFIVSLIEALASLTHAPIPLPITSLHVAGVPCLAILMTPLTSTASCDLSVQIFFVGHKFKVSYKDTVLFAARVV